uniref:Uncharacterized protein n=1 Tax=Plectus sambesii TaxID=2011161 RepID=A0A914V2K3_9BILA
MVTPPRPSSLGARARKITLCTQTHCCAVQAEDFGQVICPVRRRTALQRCSLIVQKEIEKERKNTSGASFIISKAYEDVRPPAECPNENGEGDFICSMLDYLGYTAFKLDQALNSLEKKPRRQSHPLGKYEERTTDKAGLRQTSLRIPVQPSTVAILPATNDGRELGDGQSSQSSTSSPRHPVTRRDSYIYERIGGETNDPIICNVLYDFTPENDDELALR